MAHFPVNYGIENLLRSVNTPTADAAEAAFFGNGGKIMMVESIGTTYSRGPIVNGIVQPGVIYIGTYAVDSFAATAELSPQQAAKAVAIHELGHARYAQMIYQAQPGDAASMDAKVNWCMLREGAASFYAYNVAKEMGWHMVAGTNKTPNLYDTIDAALAGIDPRSLAYEQVGIAVAKAAFAADPKYVAYCSNPAKWDKPAYIPASPPTTTPGGPGTGTVINSAYDYPPEPGGYWQPVPTNRGNLQEPDPLYSLTFEPLLPIHDIVGAAEESIADATSNDSIKIVGVQSSSFELPTV